MREDERTSGIVSRDLSSLILQASHIPSTTVAGEMNFSSMHFSRVDLNHLVYNYLVTDGYNDVAEKFKEEAQLTPAPNSPSPPSTDTAIMRTEVQDLIRSGDIQSAAEKVNDRYPELLDRSDELQFHLLQQQLIELIRSGDSAGALRFAQECIAKKGDLSPNILSEFERTLALLAFQKPESSPFSELLDVNHRQRVSRELSSAIFKEEGLPYTSQLESIFKLIVWMTRELEKRDLSVPKMDTIINPESST